MYPRRVNLWPISRGREEPLHLRETSEISTQGDSRAMTPPPTTPRYTYPGITMTPGSFYGMMEAEHDYTLYPATWSPTPLTYTFGSRVGPQVGGSREAYAETPTHTSSQYESESSRESTPAVATPLIGGTREDDVVGVVEVGDMEGLERAQTDAPVERVEEPEGSLKMKRKSARKASSPTRTKRVHAPRAKALRASTSTSSDKPIIMDNTSPTAQLSRKRKRVTDSEPINESLLSTPTRGLPTPSPTPSLTSSQSSRATSTNVTPAALTSPTPSPSPDLAGSTPPKKKRRMKGPRLCTRKYARRDRDVDVARRKTAVDLDQAVTSPRAASDAGTSITSEMSSTSLTPIRGTPEAASSVTDTAVPFTPRKERKGASKPAKSIIARPIVESTGSMRTRGVARREAEKQSEAVAA